MQPALSLHDAPSTCAAADSAPVGDGTGRTRRSTLDDVKDDDDEDEAALNSAARTKPSAHAK
jgi:hypothetical protein